jgi:hypothetical protein
MVPARLESKMIVDPSGALSTKYRRDPAPSSFKFVTIIGTGIPAFAFITWLNERHMKQRPINNVKRIFLRNFKFDFSILNLHLVFGGVI